MTEQGAAGLGANQLLTAAGDLEAGGAVADEDAAGCSHRSAERGLRRLEFLLRRLEDLEREDLGMLPGVTIEVDASMLLRCFQPGSASRSSVMSTPMNELPTSCVFWMKMEMSLARA